VLVNDNYWPKNTITITSTGTVNTNKLGSYTRTYTACDPSNNCSSVIRMVNVVKTSKPIIRLLGNDPFNLPRYAKYNEPGVSIEDAYYSDAELRPFLVMDESKIINHIPGMYFASYDVTDPIGNKAKTANRIVYVIDETSGVIDEVDKKNGFSIYPVPSNGLVNIESIAGKQIKSVKVYNVLGEEISTQKFNDNSVNRKVDMSKEKSGVYVMKIDTDKGTYSRRFNIVK